MFTFEGKDLEIYQIVQQHLKQMLGCKNVVMNLVSPSRKAILQKQIDQLVVLASPLDRETVNETINGVILVSAGATSFDQVQQRMEEGFEKGLKGRRANEAVASVARFSLITARALWDLNHPN